MDTNKLNPFAWWRIVATPENGEGVFRIVPEKKKMFDNTYRYWHNGGVGSTVFERSWL